MASNSFNPTCASCNAFNPVAQTCHALPPTQINPSTVQFPSVNSNDWCRLYTYGVGPLNAVPADIGPVRNS